MKLEIITPDKIFFSGDVESVILPGKNGGLSVLAHHAPMIVSLRKGELSYRTTEGMIDLNIEGGFVEVNNNSVVICVESGITE